MMMTVLYLSFLRIDFTALTHIRGVDLGELALWSLVKLAVLPVALWGPGRLAGTWLGPAGALALGHLGRSHRPLLLSAPGR